MERLTFEGNFCDISRCLTHPSQCGNNCSQKQVWERLKAYEDTGLSPLACAEAMEAEKQLAQGEWTTARMVELWKADKNGRLVILEDKDDGKA